MMLYYIHVPKAAGTSVIRIFENQIYGSRFKRINPTRDIHPKDFLKDAPLYIKGISEEELSAIDLIAGHFNHGIHKAIGEPSAYATILRNPIDRVISEYFYMKQMGFFHQAIIEKEDLILDDYLYHKDTYYLNNLQTRMLSGVSYENGDNLNESNYNLALKNLQEMVAIGLSERLSESLALFYLKLNWQRVPLMKNLNKNPLKPNKQMIQTESINKIKEREYFDMRLYADAERLFEKSLNNYGDKIENLANRIVDPPKFYQLYMKSIEGLERLKRKYRS